MKKVMGLGSLADGEKEKLKMKTKRPKKSLGKALSKYK